MSSTPRILRTIAVVLVTALGLAGGVFASGYAFADLGAGVALGLTAAWLVPMAALSLLALRRPEETAPWLIALTVAMVVLAPLAMRFRVFPQAWGPVVTIAMLTLAVPLAFLGLRLATTAGLLLLVLAGTQLLGTVIAYLRSPAGEVPLRHLFSGSSGVIILPLLLAAVLLLAAGLMAHERPTVGHLPRVRHSH